MNILKKCIPVIFPAVLAFSNPTFAATVSSDFSFGSGSPFGGSTVLSGVTVTLSSTVTQPFGGTAFRDLTTDEDATVKLEFSQEISEFSLDVTRVRADEFLTNFNIGNPDSLSGTLAFTPNGGVGTLLPGDFNAGTLSWTNLNTSVIEFGIETANGAALALNAFSINASEPPAAVPLPSSILFLGAGLVGLGALSRKRRKKHV